MVGLNSSLAEAARTAARRHGTPLYLYELERLRADAAAIRTSFPEPWLCLYSLKANGLPALVGEIAKSGFSASAVSRGEVELARRAGLPTARVALEGIGKTDADLALAARLAAEGQPVLWVSLESVEDADSLAHAARAAGAPRIDVLVRVNPQVTPETHSALAVGAPDAKFGVRADDLAAVISAGGGPRGPLRWRGLHLHVGSQLGAIDAWRSSFRIGLRLLELQRAELPDFDTLDAGGGFPVSADEAADVPDLALFARAAESELDELPPDKRPGRLAVEPGRAVVAGSGWLIGRVLHVRRREPLLVVLDAGMTELVRPALYGASHPILALTSLGQPFESSGAETSEVRVDGPICESTDRLGTAALPPLERGDLVAIGMAGAYGSSMASTYNGRPRAPEIAWDGERLTPWRRRASLLSLP